MKIDENCINHNVIVLLKDITNSAEEVVFISGKIEDSDNPNLIPCNKNCESCICCIEVAEDGSRSHVEVGRQ